MKKAIVSILALALTFGASIANADTFKSSANPFEFYDFHIKESKIYFMSPSGEWTWETVHIRNGWIVADNGKQIYRVKIISNDRLLINNKLYIRTK